MDFWTFALNIGAALAMGTVIGTERQMRIHTAGLRTNALVSLGAAIFVSLGGMVTHDDPTRIAAQVVSGIGFLGGGVILREGFNVRGMNTAATLWCSGAVGTLAGLGFVKAAALGTIAVVAANVILRPIADRISPSPLASEGEANYRLKIVCDTARAEEVRAMFLKIFQAQPKMDLRGLKTQKADGENLATLDGDIVSVAPNDRAMNDIVSQMCLVSTIVSVHWERVASNAHR